MISVLVALGSNVGNRPQLLADAVTLIGSYCHGRIVAVSHWYETQPIGGPSAQPPFLNGAMILESELDLEAIWIQVSEIEARLGRRREERWSPRTIDIDILLSCPEPLTTELVLPHPRMMVRDFVLSSACQIAGDWIHPVLGRTLTSIRNQLQMEHWPILIFPGDEAARDKSANLVCRTLFGRQTTPVSDEGREPLKFDRSSGEFGPTRFEGHDPLESGLQSADGTAYFLADVTAINKAPAIGVRAAIVLESWQADESRAHWNQMSVASQYLAHTSYCPFARIDLDSMSADMQFRACVEGILASKHDPRHHG